MTVPKGFGEQTRGRFSHQTRGESLQACNDTDGVVRLRRAAYGSSERKDREA